MKSALGRMNVAILQNKSGASIGYGVACILDSSNDNAVVTTTVLGYTNGEVLICIEKFGIENNAYGLFASGGYVPQVTCPSGSRLDFLRTSGVAGEITRHAAPMIAGDIGIALTDDANTPAILFGVPIQSTAPFVELLSAYPSTNVTTTSSSFGDIDGSTFEQSIDKQAGDTDILIDLTIAWYATAAPTGAQFGVINGGTDYGSLDAYIPAANAYAETNRKIRISGLAAGTQTFRARWKRVLGSGTITMDAIYSAFQMTIQEIRA